MSGEKMLQALNNADVKKDWIDAQELADVLKNLKPEQLQRWLKNKSEKISDVPGIDKAVTDLIAKHTEGLITLDPKQEKALYALHQSLLVREWGRVNLKKEWVSIVSDKESVQNQLWQSNIDNTLKDTDYTFVDWLSDGWQDNKWIAVITNQKNERYHVAFAPDGSLKTTSIKETYTRDGVLQKDTPEKIAYIGIDKKFVIEDKELFDKKLKTKEFANKLDDLSVDGIFLKQQQSDGSMNVVYFSETGLSTIVKPIFEKGEGIDPTAKEMFDTYNTAITSAEKAKVDAISAFDAGKAKIDAMTSTTTEVWRKGEVTKLETIRDGELKKQQSIIDANNENLVDLYKTYASSNVASLIDKSTDKFTINTDLTLTNALWESVSLNVDGKKDPESVSGHVALDNNNLLLKIDKTATNTGWTAYKKKVWEDTWYTTQSTKWVDVTNPVVEKPKEVVSENVDLNKRIDALNDGFMLNGGNFDKKTAIESTRWALKSLIVDGQSTVVGAMVSDMESASKASDNTQRELFNIKAQESINKIIADNKLSIALNFPSSYFVNGKLKTDGRWGKVTTDVLVKVAQTLPLKKQADKWTPVEIDAYGNTVHYIASLDTIDPTKFNTPDWGKNIYMYNWYYIYGNGRVKDSKTNEMFDRNQVKDAMASTSGIVETNKGATTAWTVEKNTTAPVSTPNTPSSAPKTAETKKPTNSPANKPTNPTTVTNKPADKPAELPALKYKEISGWKKLSVKLPDGREGTIDKHSRKFLDNNFTTLNPYLRLLKSGRLWMVDDEGQRIVSFDFYVKLWNSPETTKLPDNISTIQNFYRQFRDIHAYIATGEWSDNNELPMSWIFNMSSSGKVQLIQKYDKFETAFKTYRNVNYIKNNPLFDDYFERINPPIKSTIPYKEQEKVV